MRAVAALALLALATTTALAALAGIPGQAPAGLYEPARITLTSDPDQAGTLVAPGHVAAAEVVGPDTDLALTVGVARAPHLLGLELGAAPARVLAVPADAPAEPGPLTATGETFSFTDPHGNDWTVVEYEAAWGFAYGTAVGPLTEDPHAGVYNFVLLVDQGKLPGPMRIVAA